MSRLLSEESYQALTVILQGANMGEGYSLIPNLRDWETHWKQSKKNWKKQGRGNKPNATSALSEQSLLDNVWLNNILHFGLRGCTELQNLRWGDVVLETVKAKNILFFQRDKITADRATTHGMLGLWNRECTKTKKFKKSAIQWIQCVTSKRFRFLNFMKRFMPFNELTIFNPTIPTWDCVSLRVHRTSQKIPRKDLQKEMNEEFELITETISLASTAMNENNCRTATGKPVFSAVMYQSSFLAREKVLNFDGWLSDLSQQL